MELEQAGAPRAGRHAGPLPGLFCPCGENPNTLANQREHPRPRTPAVNSGGNRGLKWGLPHSPRKLRSLGAVGSSVSRLAAQCSSSASPPSCKKSPELPAPPGASECSPSPHCSLEALPEAPWTEGAGPQAGPAGWPSHTVSAGRGTGGFSLTASVCQAPASHLWVSADGIVFSWGVKSRSSQGPPFSQAAGSGWPQTPSSQEPGP